MNSHNNNFKGLSEFSKYKVIDACTYTLDLVKNNRRRLKEKAIDEIEKSLKARSSGWRKYFPWNKWIKNINRDMCEKILDESRFDNFLPPSYEINGWGMEDHAERILNLCRRSNSNVIYLSGNDVSELRWPKE